LVIDSSYHQKDKDELCFLFYFVDKCDQGAISKVADKAACVCLRDAYIIQELLLTLESQHKGSNATSGSPVLDEEG